MIVDGWVGARGIDTATKLGPAGAAALKCAGVDFVIRYLSLGAGENPGDLAPDEVGAILDAGLGLTAVQHVRYPGWSPDAGLGATDGERAVEHAGMCGLPKGLRLWLDLEGIAGPPNETIAYANAWYARVVAGGYLTGVYVGAEVPLDAGELYHALHTNRYWRSLSRVPEPAVRGYCMLQLYPSVNVAGINVDWNVVQQDRSGGLPNWFTNA